MKMPPTIHDSRLSSPPSSASATSPSESRQGFGSGALKVNGKIFAMMTPHAEFVVKIPKARVDELVSQGVGGRFEPGPGRIMKEWLTLDRRPELWTELAKAAYQFVKGQR